MVLAGMVGWLSCRAWCRKALLEGRLSVVAEWVASPETAADDEDEEGDDQGDTSPLAQAPPAGGKQVPGLLSLERMLLIRRDLRPDRNPSLEATLGILDP